MDSRFPRPMSRCVIDGIPSYAKWPQVAATFTNDSHVTQGPEHIHPAGAQGPEHDLSVGRPLLPPRRGAAAGGAVLLNGKPLTHRVLGTGRAGVYIYLCMHADHQLLQGGVSKRRIRAGPHYYYCANVRARGPEIRKVRMVSGPAQPVP